MLFAEHLAVSSQGSLNKPQSQYTKPFSSYIHFFIRKEIQIMSIQIIRENSLSKAEVDNVSEQIKELLEKSSVDKPTRMRIRYIIEDMILNVCNELGEETKYKLCTGKTLGRQFISFIYEGDSFDPCSSSNDPSENWSQRIMSDMGLSPTKH